MPTTTETTHDPLAEPVCKEHPDRNAALAYADAWIARRRREGCTVEWLPHGRVVAHHHRHRVAAVLRIELQVTDAPA